MASGNQSVQPTVVLVALQQQTENTQGLLSHDVPHPTVSDSAARIRVCGLRTNHKIGGRIGPAAAVK